MSETIFQGSGSITTLLGMYNQFNSFCNLTYIEDKNTTLNAKYNANANVGPSSVPTLGYFGIGTGGYKNTNVQTGARAYQPKATNMDLYSPLPIRMVPIEEDLTPEERSQYRLRVQATVNGNVYWQYWLKKMTFDPTRVRMIQKTAGGTETDYVFNPEYLNPEAPELTTGGVIDTNENRVIVMVTGICEVTGSDIMEAVNILYNGDLNRARISEFGFYTGEDRYVVKESNDPGASEIIQPAGATSGTAVEAIYIQLAKHRCSLGTDLSDSGSTLRQLINFEHVGCIEI